ILSASGGTLPYQWAAGQGFPTFLALDSATGAISGTPPTPGTFNFSVQVTDAVRATATVSLSLTVNGPPLAITTVAPIFTGTVGLPYVHTFRASGGNPPYTWSVISGSTADLVLDATTGNLQGTPQIAGIFGFTVQILDKSGSAATQSFSLTINPPSLTLTVGGQLPAGTVGVNYDQKLPVAASGGTPPYTWSLASGSIPGLTFDPSRVSLSGIPTSAGNFSFVLQLADSAGLTATRTLSLV